MDVFFDPTVCMDSNLTMGDISFIYDKLYETRTKWAEIGMRLGVDHETLSSIKTMNFHDHEKCLRAMIADRLKTGRKLTWKDICNCLRHQTVARNDTAEKIESQLKGMSANTEIKKSLLNTLQIQATVENTESTKTIPDYFEGVLWTNKKRKQISKDELKQESMEIETKFNKLQSDIFKSLETRGISKERLVVCVMGFNVLSGVYRGPNDLLFRKQRRKFDESSSIAAVWYIIADYFSFFNYEIIEQIVDSIGTAEDKEKIGEYEVELSKYAQRRIFVNEFKTSTPDSDFPELIVKLDSTYDDCELYHIKIFEKKLLQLLNLRPGVLCLRSVEEGCIQLKFFTPACIEEVVFPLSLSQENELKDLHIIRLQCGQYVYPPHNEAVSSESEGDSDEADGDKEGSITHAFNIEYECLFKEVGVLSVDYFKKLTPSSDSGISSWESQQHEAQSWKSAQNEVLSILDFPAIGSFIERKEFVVNDEEADNDLLVACYNGDILKTKFYVEVMGLKFKEENFSLLHGAILSENTDVIELILKDTHLLMWYGIFLAAFYGNLKLIKYFYRKVPDIFYSTGSHQSLTLAMVLSCVNGNLQILKYLITKCRTSFDVKSIINGTNLVFKLPLKLLDIATICNNFEIVRFLVMSYSLNPFVASDKESNKLSPMHWAIMLDRLLILKYFTMLECFDGDFSKILIASIWLGCVDVFIFLVEEQKFDPQTQDSAGFDSLQHSIVKGSVEIVNYLLKTFDNLGRESDIFGWNVLHFAAYGGDLSIFKALSNYNLPPLMIFQRNYHHATPLHLAAANGHLSIVKFITEELGIEPNIRNEFGCTPLHLAVKFGEAEVVKYLITFLTKSQLQNYNDFSGVTPLMYAVHNIQVLKILINELNHKPMAPIDKNGRCLLHYACNVGTLSVVEFLIHDCCCDPSKPDSLQLSPLHYAVYSKNINIVKYLVFKGKCDPECRDAHGFTPLHIACTQGDINLVQFFSSSLKCNVNALTEAGMTPLHLAIRCGHSNVVIYLVDMVKCDTSRVDKVGMSIAHHATLSNKTSIIKLIFERKLISSDVKDKLGLTPLHYAVLLGFRQIILLLLNFIGCDPNSNAVGSTKPIHLACDKGRLDVVKSLLARSDCAYDQTPAADDCGRTPLHYAVMNGNISIVNFLVSKKDCDVLWRDIYGHTPLDKAIFCNKLEIVDYFLNVAGDEVHKCVDTHGATPLHKACSIGNTELVKRLIEQFGCDPHVEDHYNYTALHHAVISGKLETVKFLVLDKQMSLASTKYNFKPLLLAAIHGHLDIIKFGIITLNCSPQLSDPQTHEQLIHIACQYGRNCVIEFLLQDCGCDASARTSDSKTPIHYAALGGNLQTVKLLIQNSCDPMSRDDNNVIPLFSASANGHIDVVKYFIEELGCDPNFPNVIRMIPLHAACVHEQLEVITYLLKNNLCDKLARDCFGSTPLHYAAQYGKLQSVKLLLETFACKVTEPNIKGNTPLHLAVRNDHFEIVVFLVNKFASNPLYCNQSSVTPIDLAVKNGYTKTAEFLQEAAKKLNCKPIQCDLSHLWPYLHFALENGFLTAVVNYTNDTNLRSYEKKSALHLAAFWGKLGAVVHLLQYGADPVSKDMYMNLPIHYAVKKGNLGIVKALVKVGSPINVPGYANKTPLELAIDGQHQDITEYLCSLEDNPNGSVTGNPQQQLLGEIHDTFPLHKAAKEGTLKKIKELINGHVVDEVDNTGKTPLHYAAMHGHFLVVRFLIAAANASPSSIDVFQNLPIHYAAANDHLTVVQFLVDSGSPFDMPGERAISDDTVILCTPAKMTNSFDVHNYLSKLQESNGDNLHRTSEREASYCFVLTFFFLITFPFLTIILFRKFRGRF